MDKMGAEEEAEYDEVNRRRALLTRIRAEKKREEELGEDSVDYDEERKKQVLMAVEFRQHREQSSIILDRGMRSM